MPRRPGNGCYQHDTPKYGVAVSVMPPRLGLYPTRALDAFDPAPTSPQRLRQTLIGYLVYCFS